ncbi:MAG: HAD family hydrolase [Rhodospirillales bacterium]|nr:HAD family hydrolase [Rhodospirillales bacterium]MCB9965702.1 HAD family hydrolase [Rhodospirillales bacterium]MCB9980095.1 HAD family hydrolase [Rhodospirillales bacterium]
MNNPLKNRTAILWDFDGVLYPYSFSRKIREDIFYTASIRGAREVLPHLSEEDARRMGRESHERYFDTVTGFLTCAKECGLDLTQFKKDLLAVQLAYAYEGVCTNLPELMAPCHETNKLFEALSPHIRHAVITHGHARNWTRPAARHLGIDSYFNHIFGLDDFNFQLKGQSPFAVNMALDALGAAPAEAIFIEDALPHLEVAKNAHPDLLTVFIEGETPIQKPEYVDIMVGRPRHFMKELLAAHMNDNENRF